MESNNQLDTYKLVHKDDKTIEIDINDLKNLQEGFLSEIFVRNDYLNELIRIFNLINKSLYVPKYLYFDEITINYRDFVDNYITPSSRKSVYFRVYELYNELKDLDLFKQIDHLDSFSNGKIRIRSEDEKLKTLIKIRAKYDYQPKIYLSLTIIDDHKKHLRLNIYSDDNSDLNGKLIILNQE